jgi:hypothetical protein
LYLRKHVQTEYLYGLLPGIWVVDNGKMNDTFLFMYKSLATAVVANYDWSLLQRQKLHGMSLNTSGHKDRHQFQDAFQH